MIKPLEYYFAKKGVIEHVIFNKYTIDEYGVVRNAEKVIAYTKNGKYNMVFVYDDSGKQRGLAIARAIASTFIGLPPTIAHTADHIDRNPNNDTLENIRWLCKKGQVDNRVMPETLKSAFIIIKDGEEKTIQEWILHLKGNKNQLGREYTTGMITKYSQKKQYGFSYKEYPDLRGEIWKKISGSENSQGRWEISNMNRVKYATKHAENVISGYRLGLSNGYPVIRVQKRYWLCHILSFMTFFPDEYAAKKSGEMVLHEDDDKMDFRPHKLRLGTRSENGTDAHDNGKHDGTKTARLRCASYIDGVFEKKHVSQCDAVGYLKSLGFEKAGESNIRMVIDGVRKTAYGRTWEKI
jgi:hypothetical protein